jgi:hypothetical protein
MSLNFQQAEILRQQVHDQPFLKIALLNMAKDIPERTMGYMGLLPGEQTSTVLLGKQYLANIFEDLGEWKKSESLRLDIVTQKRQTLGYDHTETFKVTTIFALCYLKMNGLEDSAQVLQRLLDLKTSAVDQNHPGRLMALQALSQVNDKFAELCRKKVLSTQNVVYKRRTLVQDLKVEVSLKANLAAKGKDKDHFQARTACGLERRRSKTWRKNLTCHKRRQIPSSRRRSVSGAR